MMTLADPVRLSASLGKGSILARALEAAREIGPTDQELASLAQALAPSLDAIGATSFAGARTIAAPALASSSKLVLVLAGAAAVAGATVGWRLFSTSTSTDRPQSLPVQQRQVESTPVDRPAAPSLQPAHSPSEISEPALSKRARTGLRKHAARVETESKTDDEIPMLQRAHLVLATDPSLALALAAQHAREFPSSSLDQERALITIQALVALGRAEEARRKADLFAKAHPGSAYLDLIKASVPR
jgi:hypothetical protein